MPSVTTDFANLGGEDGEVELEWYESPLDFSVSRIWLNTDGVPGELHPDDTEFDKYHAMLLAERYEHMLGAVIDADRE